MNNKKGFTLIELLAVIVILVIIFVIAMPVIGNVITRSRFGAFNSSKKGIEKAAELYYFSNSKEITWDNDIAYIEIGALKSKKYLKNNLINTLDNLEITDDTKVLLYKKGNKVEYSLQLYNEMFFDWYKEQMIAGSKKDNTNLPVNVGDKVTVELSMLMEKGLTDELRLPLNLENRCVGYVEIERITGNKYDYEAFVDCLTETSSFASHYVSYGGKYLDDFNDVTETSDGGYIAVGKSNSEIITKYETGNNGKYDAIIVKFKQNGEVEWSRNFGGSNDDLFNAVTEGPDGYVVVGRTSSSDGDIIDYKGGDFDAIIVKYDKLGNVLYKRSYGSSSPIDAEYFSDIIYSGNGYIIVGGLVNKNTDGDLKGVNKPVSAQLSSIISLDLNFNEKWRDFLSAGSYEQYNRVIKAGNNYIAIGNGGISDSPIHDLAGLRKGAKDSYIIEYNESGNILNKTVFGGSLEDTFIDMIEVEDGYIFVGHGTSNDIDMAGLSKTSSSDRDAIIVKYNKNFNIVWKKSFGGSDDDEFRSITKLNNNEVVVIGNSKSKDMDMNSIAISEEGYNSAIILKYNIANGNLIDKKVFGGSNSEKFTKVIKTKGNRLIASGISYSNDINLKNFNKGHQDAIIVSFDSDLNLSKTLQEAVVLIDKLKTIQPNYGTELKLKYNNIYTTNDPEKELGGWCAAYTTTGVGNSYDFTSCVTPFNQDDIKFLTLNETNSSEPLKWVYAGEQEYSLVKKPSNIRSWHKIRFRLINSETIEISNFKLKFKDNKVYSFSEAVNNGYVSPLILVGNILAGSDYSNKTFPNPTNILFPGGNPGPSTYPDMSIVFKPIKEELISVIFTTSKDISKSVGFRVEELRNFDVSISPTN